MKITKRQLRRIIKEASDELEFVDDGLDYAREIQDKLSMAGLDTRVESADETGFAFGLYDLSGVDTTGATPIMRRMDIEDEVKKAMDQAQIKFRKLKVNGNRHSGYWASLNV